MDTLTLDSTPSGSDQALASIHHVQPPSFSTRYTVLLERDVKLRARIPLLFKAKIAIPVIFGSLLGIALFRLDYAQSVVFSAVGVLSFACAMSVMPIAMGHVGTLPLQIPCVLREIRSGAYDPAAFFLAKATTDVPVDIMYTFILSGLILWMTGAVLTPFERHFNAILTPFERHFNAILTPF